MSKIVTIAKHPKLRFQSDYGHAVHWIEAGSHRWEASPTVTLSSGNAIGYLFVATEDKTLNGFACMVTNQASTPSPIGELYEVAANGEPTGSPIATTTSGVSLGSSGSFVQFTFTTPVAITAGTQYCIVLQPTGSGTFTAVGADNIYVDGWGIIYTTSINATISDTVWRWKKMYAPPIHLNFSDTTQLCAVPALGAGNSGTGAIALYGDPNGGSGRFYGICITPDFDLALKQVEVSCRYAGTAATANEMELRVYRVDPATLAILDGPWTSSNTVDPENDLASSTSNGFITLNFSPDPVIMKKDYTYVVVGCQTGNGGSSTSSHYLQLDGFTGGSYSSGGYPPEKYNENVFHGIFAVSSTAGINALAYYGTSFPSMKLKSTPFVR